MNILYIDHYAGSPEMGMEYRPYYLSREWVKMGHKVSILAGNYSHLRKQNPEIKRDMQKTVADGIDYYWLKTGAYEGNGVARALTMIRFCHKLNRWRYWIRSHIRPDVVISSSTYPIDSIPAHLIAYSGKGKRARHIHEVHDMWPLTLTEIGGMSEWNPFVMLMQFGENYAYRNADAVASLLKYAKKYMMRHGLKKDKFHFVPNGIVKEEWENPEPLPDAHRKILEKLKREGRFVVGYFGGYALSNCLSTFIQSARQMNDEPGYEMIQYVLVGDGNEKEKLQNQAKGLDNIVFLPSIEKKAIPSLTEYFDCTYIGTMDSPLYRFGACMNKMFDCMMFGKPIIFGINAPSTPVEECGCGIIIQPENISELNAAVKKMAAMTEEERRAMGECGKEEVMRKYTYEVLAKIFVGIMQG